MRIAHAIQMSILQQGGVEVLVRSLIDAACPEDEIFLISQDAQLVWEADGWQGRLSGHLSVPNGHIPGSWSRELATWLKKKHIDICHFHFGGTYEWEGGSWLGGPITVAARTGVPVVSTNHQAICFFNRAGVSRPTWRNWAAAAKVWPGKARQLMALRWEASVSRHDLAVNRRYFPIFGPKLIQVYHSRIDAARSVPPPPQSRVILNVATIAFRKGQHILVEAFARIASDFPDWQLKLVGYFAEQACLEQIEAVILDRKLEGRVHLCGPDPDPSRFYEEAEIYVQPSLVEGLGLSLQEAMFFGRACLGSAIGGIPELIVSPDVGRLFPAGDIATLAIELARLMSDPAERSKLGTAARASILSQSMTRQAMSATYRELYQQAIGYK